jgi:hypothetical protein
MITGNYCRGARTWKVAPIVLTAVTVALQAINGNAQFTLAPGDNSSVVVNPSGGNLVQDWTINGVNIMNSSVGGYQGLYYEIGNGLATPIQSGIGALTTSGPTVVGDTASLSTMYSTAGKPFSLQATYTLTGSPIGSFNSDLQETVNINNTTANTISFKFFQLMNLTVPNATVSLQTTVFRGTPLYTLAQVSGGVVALSETIDAALNPGATSGTITPGSIANLTTLPGYGVSGPAANVSGPGSAWVLEWDVTLPVNGTFTVSKDIFATVPEPSTLSLLSLGLLGFLGLGALKFCRRSSAK